MATDTRINVKRHHRGCVLSNESTKQRNMKQQPLYQSSIQRRRTFSTTRSAPTTPVANATHLQSGYFQGSSITDIKQQFQAESSNKSEPSSAVGMNNKIDSTEDAIDSPTDASKSLPSLQLEQRPKSKTSSPLYNSSVPFSGGRRHYSSTSTAAKGQGSSSSYSGNSSGCIYETALINARRRIPYSLGANPLPNSSSRIKDKLSSDEESKLTSDINVLFQSLHPTEEIVARRSNFVLKLERLLNEEWPGHDIKVHPFGSTENLLYSYESDVDVCITTPWKELEDTCKLARFWASRKMERVVCVPGAKVPIVKIWDPEYQIACDMNVNNTLALENTRMIKAYVQIDSRVRPLAMTVKHWAKQRILNDAAGGGTLSSYSWICLIINFLQTRKPPILPVLHQIGEQKEVIVNGVNIAFCDDLEKVRGFGDANEESLGALLFAFFKWYAFDFDYERQVVSVRHGRTLSKTEKGWHLMQNNRLCIEEPFVTSRNLGNTADDISAKGIQLEFRRAFEILANEGNLDRCIEKFQFSQDDWMSNGELGSGIRQGSRGTSFPQINMNATGRSGYLRSGYATRNSAYRNNLYGNSVSLSGVYPPLYKSSSDYCRMQMYALSSDGYRVTHRNLSSDASSSSSSGIPSDKSNSTNNQYGYLIPTYFPNGFSVYYSLPFDEPGAMMTYMQSSEMAEPRTSGRARSLSPARNGGKHGKHNQNHGGNHQHNNNNNNTNGNNNHQSQSQSTQNDGYGYGSQPFSSKVHTSGGGSKSQYGPYNYKRYGSYDSGNGYYMFTRPDYLPHSSDSSSDLSDISPDVPPHSYPPTILPECRLDSAYLSDDGQTYDQSFSELTIDDRAQGDELQIFDGVEAAMSLDNGNTTFTSRGDTQSGKNNKRRQHRDRNSLNNSSSGNPRQSKSSSKSKHSMFSGPSNSVLSSDRSERDSEQPLGPVIVNGDVSSYMNSNSVRDDTSSNGDIQNNSSTRSSSKSYADVLMDHHVNDPLEFQRTTTSGSASSSSSTTSQAHSKLYDESCEMWHMEGIGGPPGCDVSNNLSYSAAASAKHGALSYSDTTGGQYVQKNKSADILPMKQNQMNIENSSRDLASSTSKMNSSMTVPTNQWTTSTSKRSKKKRYGKQDNGLATTSNREEIVKGG
ncbi:hypothetical protein V1511DRAFT_511801 [Dipodascopsis uninucleata]